MSKFWPQHCGSGVTSIVTTGATGQDEDEELVELDEELLDGGVLEEELLEEELLGAGVLEEELVEDELLGAGVLDEELLDGELLLEEELGMLVVPPQLAGS